MHVNIRERVSLADAGVREVAGGYLVANPRVARTGVQLYLGSELGQPNRGVVRVYRPRDEVFRKSSQKSFAHKPITDDHPPVPVTADNWREYSRGTTGDEVVRDGEFIRVPMMMQDAELIRKVRDGKAELSAGYSCDIDWTPGVTEDGAKYDATQRDICVNHVAVVDAARGGGKLRIGDALRELSCGISISDGDLSLADADEFLDSGKKYPFARGDTVYRGALMRAIDSGDEVVRDVAEAILGLLEDTSGRSARKELAMPELKKVLVDGVTVEMTDTAQQIVDRHIQKLGDQIQSLTKKLSDAEEQLSAAEEARKKKEEEAAAAKAKAEAEKANDAAKITALETKVRDSEITPEKLDQMVKDREAVVARARAILPSVVADGKSVGEIRRQVVDSRLGEKSKSYTDDQVSVAFDTLTVGVAQTEDSRSGIADATRVFSAPPQNLTDAYSARDKRLQDAWKTPHGTV